MRKQLLSTAHMHRFFFSISSLILMMLFSNNVWAIPPNITTQPPDRVVCVGANTTFHIIASNTTSYQWQENTGSGWNNVIDGGVYSNATTNILTLTSVTTGMSSYQYRCIATGPDNPAATSNAGTLTVNTPAVITVPPPTTATICSGQSTSFSVTATGTISSYQWYIHNGVTYVPLSDGGFYSGATTSTLNIAGITAAPNTQVYSYFCAVSSPCGGGVTVPTYLTVNALPAVTTNPADVTVCTGYSTSFEVNATGANLSYQWQLSINNGLSWSNLANDATYSHVTDREMEMNAIFSLNNNMYRCVVSGACTPSAASAGARLTVKPLLTVTTQPLNKQVCPGGTTTIGATGIGTNVTYQWQENSGSGWSNLINGGVYSGVTSSIMTLTNVPLSYHNYRYRCFINDSCATSTLSNEAFITVPTPVTISAQPVAAGPICSGGNASYTVTASGDGIGYQWYRTDGPGYVPVVNGGIYSGANTPTLNITGITAAPNAQTYSYYCVVSGTCGGDVTPPLYLLVNAPPAITSNPADVTVCAGFSTSFIITATGTNLTYQWQSSNNGTLWTNLTNNAVYSNVTTRELEVNANFNLNNIMYRCVVSGICGTPVETTPAKMTVKPLLAFTTQPIHKQVCPGGNTTFGIVGTGTQIVYQWQLNTGSGWNNIANGGVYAGVTTDVLTLTNIPVTYNAYRYRCYITDSCGGQAYSVEAVLTVPTPVVITAQPATAGPICTGGNASYTVAAVGDGIAYQWYRIDGMVSTPITNGGIYSGATSATLNITGITAAPNAQTYAYFCAVSGTCGGDATPPTYLLVNAAPAVTTNPMDVTICNGFATSFEINATGTGITYQWQISTNGGVNWTNLANDATYSNVTAREMEVNATAGLNNAMYRCMVSGTCTPAAFSAAATITVNTAPMVTVQPVNTTVCENTNATFGLTATGAGLMYQWQVNNGSGWTNITNGGVYSNATTAMLNLTGVTVGMQLYRYRCIVTGTCAPSPATSAEATLNINTAPVVTVQPQSIAACPNGTANFSVMATGTGLTYQWEVNSGSGWNTLANGGVYTGATTAMLNLAGAGTGLNNNQYRCVVSGTCVPAATSSAATLTFNTIPAITTQPVNTTVCVNANTALMVAATGTGLMYQWQVSTNGGANWNALSNTITYAGVTSATLSITAAPLFINNYQYRCVVSGTCTPAVTSDAITMTVNTPPAVTGHPVSNTICAGANTSFNVTATGAGLGYQWQVNTGASWANVTNGGAYSNATTATLNITGVIAGFNGYKYRCIVNGTCAPSTTTSGEATLNVNTAPAITVQPTNKVICPNTNTSFAVTATGAGLTYQWQVNSGSGWNVLANGGIYSGVSAATLNLTGATVAVNNNQYRCVVTGTCTPPATSGIATLTFNSLPVINTQPVNTAVCLNNNTAITVAATGTGLGYQWQVSTDGGINWTALSNNATYSNVTTATLNITAAQLMINGYRYRCAITGLCANTISSVALLTVNTPTAIANNPASMATCPAGNAQFTVMATGSGLSYQWQVNTGSGWANVSNGGVYAGANTNMLALTNVSSMFNSYQYRCNVNGICAPLSLTSGAATLTVNSNIAINTQPAATTTICSGGNTSLTVGATGTGIAYQWYVHNGTNFVPVANGGIYSGATTATLNITGITSAATAAKVYPYYCSVTGTCQGALTTTSYITVNALPAITASPANVTVCDMANNVSFQAGATGTGLIYQWQENTGSGWVNLSNNSNITGATTSQLLFNTVSASMSGNNYRCMVSGACTPSVTSGSAVLTVNPLVTPSVSISLNNNNVCAGTLVTFTATPTNGGSNPSYQWRVNGVNVGSNSATYVTTSLVDQNVVTCQMTSSIACPSQSSVISNSITMNVVSYQLPTVSVMSSSGTTECSGVPVTFTASSTYGGPTPSYQWQLNGVNVGTDTTKYVTDSLKNGDVVRCLLISTFMCPSSQVVSSNNLVMNINQTTLATVSISTSPDTTICKGQKVILYSYYTNSGFNPQFQWMRNGAPMPGETGATLTSTNLYDNDVITCKFFSSVLCVLPVESDTLRFNVDEPVAPSVKVAISYNGGNSYTITATPTNGGTNPTYKWYVNGSAINNPGAVFISSQLKKTDDVYVVMTSNHPCVQYSEVNSRLISTGLDDEKTSFNELKLYPNPNTGRFTVAGEYSSVGNEDVKITIVNALGQVIYTDHAKTNGGKLLHEINMNSQPAAGMYIMRLEVNGKQDLKRFNVTQ